MMIGARLRLAAVTAVFAMSEVFCFAADAIPGKTFELDFENADGKAKFARGKDMPYHPYATPVVPGVSGKAYRLTKDGKELSYCLGKMPRCGKERSISGSGP